MENKYLTEIQKRGYLSEDFRLFHLKDDKGTEMDFHYHEFSKLVILLSGCGNYTVEERHYALQPGDILLIGNGRIHRPEFVKGTEYERIIFYVSPEFLQRQSTDGCDLNGLFDHSKGHVIRLKEHRYKKLLELASELEEEITKDSFGKNIMANSLLLQFLVKLERYRGRDRQMPDERPEIKDGRIGCLISYIETHLSEELSVDDLADIVFMSRYHMMRLFKKETGQSVYEYLTERRLFFARELIRRGVSATECCFLAGFGSYSSFTRAYGKRFGTTPTGRNGKYIITDEDAG